MARLKLNHERSDIGFPSEEVFSRFVRAFSGLLVIALGWLAFVNLMIFG